VPGPGPGSATRARGCADDEAWETRTAWLWRPSARQAGLGRAPFAVCALSRPRVEWQSSAPGNRQKGPARARPPHFVARRSACRARPRYAAHLERRRNAITGAWVACRPGWDAQAAVVTGRWGESAYAVQGRPARPLPPLLVRCALPALPPAPPLRLGTGKRRFSPRASAERAVPAPLHARCWAVPFFKNGLGRGVGGRSCRLVVRRALPGCGFFFRRPATTWAAGSRGRRKGNSCWLGLPPALSHMCPVFSSPRTALPGVPAHRPCRQLGRRRRPGVFLRGGA
jgi:hypothetical protein